MQYEDKTLAAAWWARLAATPKGDGREARIARLKYESDLELEQWAIRQRFMDRYGLLESSGRSCNLMRAVRARSGPRLNPFAYGGPYGQDVSTLEVRAMRWFDHTEMFRAPAYGLHVITTQPYDLDDDKYSALQELCERIGAGCTVEVSNGWHYPGACPLVIVHPKGLSPRDE